MSALSFSSVQYLSGAKLTGDASIFVVAVQAFRHASARSHDPQSRLLLDDSWISLINNPRCPVEADVDWGSFAQ